MPTPQNGQAHLDNSSAVADELFECVWPFCGAGTERIKYDKNQNPRRTAAMLPQNNCNYF